MDQNLILSVGVSLMYLFGDYTRFSFTRKKDDEYKFSESLPMAIFVFIVVLIGLNIKLGGSSGPSFPQSVLTEPFDSK